MLDAGEFTTLMRRVNANLSDDDTIELFRRADIDGSGTIEFGHAPRPSPRANGNLSETLHHPRTYLRCLRLRPASFDEIVSVFSPRGGDGTAEFLQMQLKRRAMLSAAALARIAVWAGETVTA